jgi:oxygen-independent coproporphyrinogen-3 oxidase
MKLLLTGHTERYPVEQLQMQLFPDEPSELVTAPFAPADGAVSALHEGKIWVTATAAVTRGGRTCRAARRVKKAEADVRHVRRILQQSYYLAALPLLPAAPPWGALAGVRPSKLSTQCLASGGSGRDADRLLKDTYFVSAPRRRLCVDASRHTLEAARLLDKTDLSVYVGFRSAPRAAPTARL